MQRKQEYASVSLTRMNIRNDSVHVTLASGDIFLWPQHSSMLEKMRAKSCKISQDIEHQLTELGLYKEEDTTKMMDGKVLDAARNCARSIRRRVWISFDIFMARDRPGLGLEEGKVREEGERKEKKGRNRRPRNRKKNIREKSEKHESFTQFIKPEDECHLVRAV